MRVNSKYSKLELKTGFIHITMTSYDDFLLSSVFTVLLNTYKIKNLISILKIKFVKNLDITKKFKK